MYETIFQNALSSQNPEAILKVAYAFEGLGYHHKARMLFGRLNQFGIGAARTKRVGAGLKPARTSQRHKHYHQQQQQQQQDSSGSGTGSGSSGGGSPAPSLPSPPSPDDSSTEDDNVGFGAMARGTPIKGTNGAVIPPGRYWLDLVDEGKRKAWVDLTVDKPEITIEKSEWSADVPGHVIETVIFSIPPTANNYGLPGVFFPTQILGFPTIAGSASNPYAVQSKADTVQRPAPMTHAEAIAEFPRVFEKEVDYLAQAAGRAAGAAAKGAGQGLGMSTTEIVLAGIGVLVGLFFLNRLMMPTLPVAAHLSKAVL